MIAYTDFIPENVAPANATGIAVCKNGKALTHIELGNLAFPPSLGQRLYSFLALSDVHVSSEVKTSEEDFRRALRFAQDVEGADFCCIAGDLTQYASEAEWELYEKCISEEAAFPVYPIGGNHDCYGSGLTDAVFEAHTGHKASYTFGVGDDVFIMLSQLAWASQSGNVQPFVQSQLQWLYEQLESGRNKRCFVFIHPFPWGRAGDPFKLYSSNSFFGNQGTLIYSLMEHYRNALWLHGHSHQMFETQKYSDIATYDHTFGCHNIHIPSCAKPVLATSTSRTEEIEGSQGYLIDVYENGIHLKGRDFVAGAYLPIASYCLDTTLVEIGAKTFSDSTGLIKND